MVGLALLYHLQQSSNSKILRHDNTLPLVAWVLRYVNIPLRCSFISDRAITYNISVTGIMWLLQDFVFSPWSSAGAINWTIPFFSLSLSLNILLTIAIVLRLLLFRRHIVSVLGQGHGRQYTSVAAMIVESASIFSVFSLLFLVPFALNNPLNGLFFSPLGGVQVSPLCSLSIQHTQIVLSGHRYLFDHLPSCTRKVLERQYCYHAARYELDSRCSSWFEGDSFVL